MIKTKIFMEGFDDPSIDEQINKWIAKHPDYIVMDVKLSTDFIEEDNQLCCNETVMLDEVYQDGQSYVSKKLPRIGARFDMLRKPTLYR